MPYTGAAKLHNKVEWNRYAEIEIIQGRKSLDWHGQRSQGINYRKEYNFP